MVPVTIIYYTDPMPSSYSHLVGIRVQTLIAATSKLASFKIRPYLQPIQINTFHVMTPQLINHVGTLNKQY